jgi:hypothetical protein
MITNQLPSKCRRMIRIHLFNQSPTGGPWIRFPSAKAMYYKTFRSSPPSYKDVTSSGIGHGGYALCLLLMHILIQVLTVLCRDKRISGVFQVCRSSTFTLALSSWDWHLQNFPHHHKRSDAIIFTTYLESKALICGYYILRRDAMSAL